ncbi:MAG: prephenate dehydrogenase/arogenate dehydrogenase family protein [Thermodesulfobacteriota bacterium]
MQINTISIIGGLGAMGQFFKSRFERQGSRVETLDNPLTEENIRNTIPGCDAVLLATPTHACEEVLQKISDYLDSSTILADICSVKMRPLKIMLKMHSGPVVGTHPLFGPNPENEEILKTAIVPGREESANKSIHFLMQAIGLAPFTTTAEEHDRALAFIQGLNFVSTVSYLAAIPSEDSIKEFLTPSFRRRLEASQKMLTQDWEMFENIFEANPYSQEAVRQLRSYLNLASAGELDLLRDKASWWWDVKNTGGGS